MIYDDAIGNVDGDVEHPCTYSSRTSTISVLVSKT